MTAIAAIVGLAGCSINQTNPEFVYSTMAASTHSTFMTRADAVRADEIGRCLVLAAHEYAAPVAMTSGGDVRNPANGIDEIVQNDGGNAYAIGDYVWVPYPGGAVQLVVEFYSYLCADEAAPDATPLGQPETTKT